MKEDNQSVSNELFTYKFEMESKTYFFDLKENSKGRFLEINELSNKKRNSIIIPEEGLKAFLAYLKRTVEKWELLNED
ncbi:DNA-binding protein [bacterium]|nr:DNA-binding protein [bacterium]MBU0900149.1 DNA-binding protein [bacterium]MBU1153690.1 DNA-binding protein [bacterium]MBU1782368.1 DNA-binding protein [bacterium]